jgi:hypothetical protein
MEKSKFKKIILILGFAALIFLVGYLIWNTFFKDIVGPPIEPPAIEDQIGDGLVPSPEGPGIIIEDPEEIDEDVVDPDEIIPPTAIVPPTTVSPIATGGITQVTTLVQTPSVGTSLGRDGNSVQFYNSFDGKFYMANERGDLIPLSDRVFHNVQDVEWAPNKTKAVIEYPDRSKIIYDFETEKQVTIPRHWEDFSFSTDSDKIVHKSLANDPDNRWLVVTNTDGTQSRPIEFVGNNDAAVIPSWSPNNQSVAMYIRGVDFDRNEVIFLGADGQNFKSTRIEGWDFDPLWSEKGDRLLYSVYSTNSDLKPGLWIVDAIGDDIGKNRSNLHVETWAEKCTFANNTEVYCAVPKELKEGSGLFPELAHETTDNLYKINTQTGQKELIAIPDTALNISQISASKDGRTLFFTDRLTGGVHKINLK